MFLIFSVPFLHLYTTNTLIFTYFNKHDEQADYGEKCMYVKKTAFILLTKEWFGQFIVVLIKT